MMRRLACSPARACRAALILGLLLALSGCNSEPKVSDRNLAYIEDPAMMEALSKREKRPVVVVDARPAHRYELAHIPGAINIPLPEAKRDDDRLKDAKLIIVYALDWEDPVAQAMSKKLLALGYKGVQTYRGGLREWVAKGRETEPPTTPANEDPN